MAVDIIDLGSGNIRSIKNWIEKSNINARAVQDANELKSEVLILPGVGAAGSYMERLCKNAFHTAIIKHVSNGGRLIGICLGFQIMSSFSEEDGGVEGLGLIDAEVKKLSNGRPHNGWESFYLRKDNMEKQTFNATEKLSRKTVLNGRVFYNHEYGVVNKDPEAFTIPVSPEFDQYVGLFVKDKIIGMQFHPEKSQLTGLELISMML
jgi:imidazole glycerol-phosphate synthase subunit HisH